MVKDANIFCATIPNPWELQQELLWLHYHLRALIGLMMM